MHRYTDETERLAQAVLAYERDRLRMDPSLDGPVSPAELRRRAGQTITEGGLGGEAALRIFTDVLAPAVISSDRSRSHLPLTARAPTAMRSSPLCPSRARLRR